MSFPIQNISMQQLRRASATQLMEAEDAVHEARQTGGWPGKAPLFAHELAATLYCSLNHERIFANVLDTIRSGYRRALMAQQASVACVQVPVSEIPPLSDVESMTRDEMEAWIFELARLPHVGQKTHQAELEPTSPESWFKLL